MDKVSARVGFKPESKELPALREGAGLNEEYTDSAVGCDGSSNTSESLYAEKHDASSTHEIDSLKSTISGDLGGHSLNQSPRLEKGDPPDHRFLGQGNNDWVHGWGSDYSVDNDLAIANEENSRLRGSLEVAESSIYELKLEVNSLQIHADAIGLETQKFAHHLSLEVASGEELAKEVSVLKSECSKLKGDLERLKSFKLSSLFSSTETIETDQNQLFQNLQLKWLKGLMVMEDKVLELQNKACLEFHETDFRFLHPDLEVLLGVVQNLKQGTGQAFSVLNKVKSTTENVKEIGEMNIHKSEQFGSGIGFDSDLYQPDSMLHCLNILGLASQEPDSVDATDAMKGKIFELLRELDEAKAERESHARKMNQMECYYEALIQELEENQKQMLGELHNLRNEHSTCLYTLSSSKDQMEAMHQEMNEQILRFAEDRRNLDALNKELEKRAITSEAALKRARLNYSIAVDHLQKDLELLSFQVLSMFETNENLIREAFTEASLPCSQVYLETVQKQNQHFQGTDASKLLHCQNRSPAAKKELLGGDVLLEDMKRSLHLQKELYQKIEDELFEMYFLNLHLDVFSKTLQESLQEASADVQSTKDKMGELTQKLEHSIQSKELLTRRLRAAMDDVDALNEYKASCVSKGNDMALHNKILEENLRSVASENCFLNQKITEWEPLVMECRNFERKYEGCAAEKKKMENLLQQEALEKKSLRDEIFALREQLKSVKTESDELASVKDHLQRSVNLLQDKLGTLLANYDRQFKGLSLCSKPLCSGLDFKDLMGVVSQMEEYQHIACGTILHLMEEKKDLENQRDTAQSEILVMKEKFKGVQDTVNKVDVSNVLVQKLQLNLDAITNRLQISSETEEKYAHQKNEIFSVLEHLEVELRQLTIKNRDLAEEIQALTTVTEELERSKLTISEFAQKNQALMLSLQEKTDESVNLASELTCLKESLRSLHDELRVERGTRDKIEDSVTELTLQLGTVSEELGRSKLTISECVQNNQALTISLQEKTEESVNLASELTCLKESLRSLHDELRVERGTRDKLEDTVTELTPQLGTLSEELGRCKLIISEFKQNNQALTISLQEKTDESVTLASELNSLKESLGCLHDELHVERGSKDKFEDMVTELMSQLGTITEELGQSKLIIAEFAQKNHALMTSLHEKTDESVNLATELDSLKENLRCLHDELSVERCTRDKLEGRVTELTSQLNEKNNLLLHFDLQKAELVHFKQQVADLESEKSQLDLRLLHSEACLEKVYEESFSATGLESQLSEMHELLIIGDVKIVFTKTQYEGWIEEFLQQLESSARHLEEFHQKNLNVETTLNRCLASEAHYVEENARLMTTIESLRSDLEASVAQNNVLLDSNSAITTDLEEYKKRAAILEGSYLKDTKKHTLEVQQLKHTLACSEEEIENLILFKEELEIKVVVLTSKLEGCIDELLTLRKQCNELSNRLSEQMLKTEEFRNLSVHFKELKDKADAECLQARQKRDPEVPSGAVQESLRIAFIKEQYETKLQELRHQLSISKKHNEEMLWKLQDAIDEVENRKKSEASHLKNNEELLSKKLELEAELQAVISDKRERIMTYDQIQAELECSLISLECCKEEKQKLEISLQECNEEKAKIADELILMKEQLQKWNSTIDTQKEGLNDSHKVGSISGNPVVEKTREEVSVAGTWNGNDLVQDGSKTREIEDLCSFPIDVKPKQDVFVSRGIDGIQGHSFVDQENLLDGDTKQLALINDHFKTKSLRSSLDHLHNELERMKNENSLLPHDDDHYDPCFHGLQSELMQLHKANEELRCVFPSFNELSDSGNALERVLALEIELAEALQAKKKSSIHFQSSFLKQHNDEEAVFKSFKDINELIKDMLEVKGKYAVVETELKEMHDRYSQLSLQFAEVEGERQKLMMTLKNVRASKKLLQLNLFSSATLGENSS